LLPRKKSLRETGKDADLTMIHSTKHINVILKKSTTYSTGMIFIWLDSPDVFHLTR